MKNKLIYSSVIIAFVVLLEVIFSIFVFNKIGMSLLFGILNGLILLLMLLLVNKNKIITYILLSLITLIFIANYIYYSIYSSIISIYSYMGGAQVAQFYTRIWDAIKSNFIIILLLLIPLIIFIILDKKKIISFNKGSRMDTLYVAIITIILNIILILIVNMIPGLKTNYNGSSAVLFTKDFGLVEETKNDLYNFVFKKKTSSIIDEEEPIVIPTIEYNKMDIDFDTLIADTTDTNLIMMYNYFKNQEATEKNEYTGMFEGKNLIVFVAEAFSEMAIDETITPTLYKLYNEGFQFKNFYTPIFPVSTADGEYITDTSLIPKEGVWTMKSIVGKAMPFVYPNMFEALGYSSNSYHDHYATYYDRDHYLISLGYDKYTACYRNLNMNCTQWPNSDLSMMKATMDDYINNDQFLAYYMTVSGHLEYTREGNAMVSKNWSTVANLPYSYRAKSYLAANKELDLAIAYTIERLTAAGKLDDTVIIVSSDHYPYGLNLNEINELSSYKKDDNFEKHRNAFLIWSGSMEKPIVVDKLGSSLDVLPTMLNLFGMNYDSRLLMGKDILSNADPLIIYSNRSFITDMGRYNSINGSFSATSAVDADYVAKIKTSISNKYLISKLIVDKDFYNVIRGQLY